MNPQTRRTALIALAVFVVVASAVILVAVGDRPIARSDYLQSFDETCADRVGSGYEASGLVLVDKEHPQVRCSNYGGLFDETEHEWVTVSRTASGVVSLSGLEVGEAYKK